MAAPLLLAALTAAVKVDPVFRLRQGTWVSLGRPFIKASPVFHSPTLPVLLQETKFRQGGKGPQRLYLLLVIQSTGTWQKAEKLRQCRSIDPSKTLNQSFRP